MPPLVKQNLIIGTRGSKLAVTQAEMVMAKLRSKFKNYTFSIKTIQTSGDKFLQENLSKIGGKGLFIKEIEEALKKNEIHIAVHSLKDMPTVSPSGFVIAGVLKRDNPCDVFISNKYSSLKNINEGALIGTSSARRKAILLEQNSKIRIINFRGNVVTRLKKLDDDQVDGIILSYAGLERLKLTNRISQKIPLKEMLPSPGQGAICIECLEDNNLVKEMIQKINHTKTMIETNCEREFLKNIEGDCKTPISAYAKIKGNKIKLEINIIHPCGIRNYYDSITGDVSNHLKLAKILSDRGKYKAYEILEYIKRHA
jgi:hydroxymethylbilane synthase